MRAVKFGDIPLPTYQIENTAKHILAEIMSHRRLLNSKSSCEGVNCKHCMRPHLSKVMSAVSQKKQLQLVLPGFPGKSPNREKVLGHLPDKAERLALAFLQGLAEKIKHIYPPGVKIVLCSDGRVFSDLVGIEEHHITQYQHELSAMIEQGNLSALSTFNLDATDCSNDFKQMRIDLMSRYGASLDRLQQKIRQGVSVTATADEISANHMYRGITRFLYEDSLYPGQVKSRTSIQKESRVKAYEVIRRSNAWSELIADHFPEAIRLSIHPQACGSMKLAIRLVEKERWITPWHAVAVETASGYVLRKRAEVERMGARLMFDRANRPSHYSLLVPAECERRGL